MFFKSGISLVITSLEREKNINKTKKKMKGNGKLFFSVYHSLEAVSLEQKSTVQLEKDGNNRVPPFYSYPCAFTYLGIQSKRSFMVS